MPAALPLTDRISQGATRTRRNRLLTAQFGDGYSQEAPDGINATYDEWQLSFENLTSTERTTLWNALDAVGAWDYLTWTPPGGSAGRFKVMKDSVRETPVSGDLYSVSLSLKQVF